MSASILIERLQVAKPAGTGRWTARCPAHEDRSPSLSIRELDDGRVLVHCHAGCAASDVMAAVGLSMSDLFPDGPAFHHGKGVLRKNQSRAFHAAVVEIAAADLAAGKRLSQADIGVLKAARNWLLSHPVTEEWT